MDCYTDFIVFRTTCPGVTAVKPKSRLFYEDLPGISCSKLAAIEPGKYNSAVVMAEEKMRVAMEKVLDMAGTVVEPYIKTVTDLEAGEVGSFDDGSLQAGSALARGLRLKMDGGILMRMLIPRVFLRCEEAVADLVVTVTDGDEVHTYTLDIEANTLTSLDLHLEARSKTVDITIADVRYKPMGGTTKHTQYYTSCKKCTSTATYLYLSGVGISEGVEDTGVYGIIAQVVATCTLAPAACMLLNKLRWPVLYQWGVEVMDEHISTDRMNFLGIHGKEQAQKNRDLWAVEVQERMEKEARGLTGFIAKLTPECVSCGTGITMGYARP